jgi:hypothetical protein
MHISADASSQVSQCRHLKFSDVDFVFTVFNEIPETVVDFGEPKIYRVGSLASGFIKPTTAG